MEVVRDMDCTEIVDFVEKTVDLVSDGQKLWTVIVLQLFLLLDVELS